MLAIVRRLLAVVAVFASANASALEVTLSASAEAATRGDAVTFTLRVLNDAQPRALEVRFALPTSMQPVGARLVTAIDGAAVETAVESGGSSLVVRGALRAPLLVPAGGRLVVRFQGMVGPAAREGQRLSVAALVTENDVALTRSDVAVRVEGEALFDRATVLGRVTCEGAGGRVGVYGARVVLDTGRLATTDADGRFHFTAVQPGLRALKVDANSLLPGTQLVDAAAQTLVLTRGFTQSVVFHARCDRLSSPADLVQAGRPSGAAADGANETAAVERVVVSGNVGSLELTAQGQVFAAELPRISSISAADGGGYSLSGPAAPRAWRVLATHAQGITTLASGVLTPLPARLPPAPAGSVVVLEVDDAVSTVRSVPVGASPAATARVEVARRPVPVDAEGRFAAAPARPADGVVEVHVVRADGAERRARLPVGQAAQARVRVDFRAGVVEVAGQRADLAATRARIRLADTHLDSRGGRPVRFVLADMPAGVASWEARLLDPMGEVVWSHDHTGAPPSQLSFTPDQLAPGEYAYALDLVLNDGTVVRTPRGTATARAADPSPADASTRSLGLPVLVEVDGQAAQVGRDDRVDAPLPAGAHAAHVVIRGHDGEVFERDFNLDAAARRAGSTLPEVAYLRDALANGPSGARLITPAALLVELPPSGSTLNDPTVPVRGRLPGLREAGATVTVNGVAAALEAERFTALVTLPVGESQPLEVLARFPDGRVASVRRTYRVADSAWFLLAVADGALTGKGFALDEHSSAIDAGPVGLAGRVGLVFKGRMRGGELVEQLKLTAMVDTARGTEATPYLTQLLDPDRYYPVYGDASLEADGFEGRQKLYVALEAGQSRAVVGAFRAGLHGIDLYRFDRRLDGALVHVDETWAEGWSTRAELFTAWDQQATQREARFDATGGSHFTLPDRDLVKGSESVWLEIVDRDSGLVLHRVDQHSGDDYRIDLAGGRLIFARPVSMDARSIWPLGRQGGGSRHGVRVAASYMARRGAMDGVLAGGFVKQELGGAVTLGGGYVRDGQGWDLAGAEAELPLGPVTVAAEVAHSRGSLGAAALSANGGLTTVLPTTPTTGTEAGWGYTVNARAALNDELTEEQWLGVDATYQEQQRGFASSATLGRHAARRASLAARYSLDAHTQLTLHHDTLVDLDSPLRHVLTGAGASAKLGAWSVGGEVLHAWERARAGDDVHRGALFASARWALLPAVALRVGQGVELGGDPLVYDDPLTRPVTELGLEVRPGAALQLYATERVRWSGADETLLGVRVVTEPGTTVYVEHRLAQPLDDEAWRPSTVVGSEQRAGDTRTFAEWQTGGSVSGPYARSVLGVGRRFKWAPGFYGDLGLERQHGELMAPTSDGLEGPKRRDTNALYLSSELVGLEKVKLTGRVEVLHSVAERVELGLSTTAGLAATLTPELTLLGRIDYAFTNDADAHVRLAEHLDASIGAAWRPAGPGFMLLAKYTHRGRLSAGGVQVAPGADRAGSAEGVGDTESLAPAGTLRSVVDVVGLEPIWTLGRVLQLSPKFAWRRAVYEAEGLSATGSNAWLVGLRVGVSVWERLELAAEYRLNVVDVMDTSAHGALGELAVRVTDFARVGVGYGWGFVEDDGERPFGERTHGFFVRLSGLY